MLFDIIADPNPTTGALTFVENGDPIFDTLFVQNYININLGTGTIDAYSQNDSGANSINFSTLSTRSLDALSFKVYPNPTDSIISIQGNLTKLISIDIVSILGQNLMTISSNFEQIDVSSLKSGVIFIRLNMEVGSKIYKIVKN